MTAHELVDWSGPLAAGDARWGLALGAFLRRTRRLPTNVGRTALLHQLSARAPARPEAAALVRALAGRVGVLNYGAAATIPAPAASLAWALARTALGAPAPAPGAPGALGASSDHLGDARAAAERRRLDEFRRAGGAAPAGLAWCAAALREARDWAVRLGERAADGAPTFVATRTYQLAVVGGRGGAPAAPAALAELLAAARAPAWPRDARGRSLPWFRARVLLGDDEALARMTAEAALAYREATGRLGGSARDTYWRAELWERFTEPGRGIGLVTPESLGRRPRGRGAPGGAADGGWGAARPASLWPQLDPRHDVATGIPPAWCLVEMTATLDVATLDAAAPAVAPAAAPR